MPVPLVAIADVDGIIDEAVVTGASNFPCSERVIVTNDEADNDANKLEDVTAED